MKICIPLHLSSEKKLFKILKKIPKKADLVEIRLDEFENPDIKKMMEKSRCRVIFTYRKNFNWEKIQNLIDKKVPYLDIDITTHGAKRSVPFKIKRGIDGIDIFQKIPKKRKTKVIISYHDYKKTPSEKKLHEIAEKCFNLGADIAKIATTVKKEKDNKTVLSFLKNYRKKYPKRKIIVHGMGKNGKKSRIQAAKAGSYIFYAALNQRYKTAEGQWTLEELGRKAG